MNYKLNYMCLKRGVSLVLGHGVYAVYRTVTCPMTLTGPYSVFQGHGIFISNISNTVHFTDKVSIEH